jgi:hypothetical protein
MFCPLMDVHCPQSRGKDIGPPRKRIDPYRWLVVGDGRVRQVPQFVHLLSSSPKERIPEWTGAKNGSQRIKMNFKNSYIRYAF